MQQEHCCTHGGTRTQIISIKVCWDLLWCSCMKVCLYHSSEVARLCKLCQPPWHDPVVLDAQQGEYLSVEYLNFWRKSKVEQYRLLLHCPHQLSFFWPLSNFQLLWCFLPWIISQFSALGGFCVSRGLACEDKIIPQKGFIENLISPSQVKERGRWQENTKEKHKRKQQFLRKQELLQPFAVSMTIK